MAEREREKRPGAWVVAARNARDLNQLDLAFRCRKYPSTVSRWENGGIDWLSWIGLLHVLQLPADWEPGKPVPPMADDAG